MVWVYYLNVSSCLDVGCGYFTGALFGARWSGLAIGVIAWVFAAIGLARGMRAVSRSRLLGVNDGV